MFAYTVNTGSHFKGYYTRENSWYEYDGLATPEIRETFTPQSDGRLEHVVLLRNVDTVSS